ncbi:MAG: saccharopine dehydrogenase [Salinivirgaceae bacterium]|nr:MAG: saccharopine dehydrogenase [Salinivirgaceae bacterium]
MKHVLILGSGMVAAPIIEYLLNKEYFVGVAGIDTERSEELINNHPNGKAIYWDADDVEGLKKLAVDYDLLVSLLPYKFHVMVAKVCLEFGKHMVTTSYVKPEMQDLHNEAVEKGLLLLNEIGLDPGIDHMSAMKIIYDVHQKGGEIEEFYSITGALPDPAIVDNPLGYKFSLSPKGVILASKNDAEYLKDGLKVYVEPKKLFQDIFEYNFPDVGVLDVYPNRNSIDYIDIYKIPEVKTILRGTFRLKNWCLALDVIKQLNLLCDEKADYSGKTFADFVRQTAELEAGDIKESIAKKVNIPVDSPAIESLAWLGLLDEKDMGRKEDSPFEITSDVMIEKMWMEEGDRDMVAMQHVFKVKWQNGDQEVIKSRLLDFGDPKGHTSVAKTVALPAAVAVDQILKGNIALSGVYRPVEKVIYEPVMKALTEMNIEMVEEFGLPLNQNIEK